MNLSSSFMLGLLGDRPGPFQPNSGKGLAAQLQPPRVNDDAPKTMSPQDGIAILRQRLEARFEAAGSFSSRLPQAEVEPPGPEEVANRVLGFVESRIREAAANGADGEKLTSMLSQARQGVADGFEEAREEIAALGRMNDDLSESIDDSYNRIVEGLDRLEESLFSDDAAESAGDAVPQGTAGQSGSGVEGRYSLDARTRESVAVEVKTRDGDVVTLTLDERSRFSAQGSIRSGEQGSEVRYSESQSFVGRYAISVEGQLDAGEMESLQSLFAEVDDLSSRFFGGDVQGAFDQALNMGIDGEELASYSINLRQVQSVQASAYTRVSDQPSPGQQLQPAADFARRLDGVTDRGQRAGMDVPGISALLDRMLADREREGADMPQPRRDLGQSFLATLLDQMAEQRASA